jgi:glycine hydroxymethyltransferase
MINEITSLIQKHEQWRLQDSINLIPSENVTSPQVRSLLASDLGHRYTSPDHFYMGTRFTDEIERAGEELAKKVFGAAIADLRPLSGHIADLIVLASLTKPNDTIICVSAEDGGYPGIWEHGAPGFLQLKTVRFPFLKKNMNINLEKAVELIEKKRPRLVIFGASLFLFPHPVKELAKVAREVKAQVCYDGSHVLGLIAGKTFQDPLREGTTLLFGSTHKSFFGPQGGIILTDKEHGETIKKRIFPALVDNAHWNRIAALALSLAEMKDFGREYATQVIKNAQALAKALAEYGFPVVCSDLGFTQSHQVYLDYGSFGNGRKIASPLEKANIITDCGVRLGTCEITRRGMKQKEMPKIAEFIKRVVKDREQPSKVKPEVTKFVKEFREIKYCFK